MAKSVLIVGGGMAGLSAAYELTRMQRAGADVSFTLVEASPRLGGILETHRQDGFTVELGPDGWVSEKPWARELAVELGLESQLLPSNDVDRVTYVLRNLVLEAMPEGMRMMVPVSLASLDNSPLFSDNARAAYAAELQRADELRNAAPDHDESVASFVQRHFGDEVLRLIGAPLLGGIFGGDVHKLSVRAVMKPYVEMEREHGSLIAALQARGGRPGKPVQSIFTSLTTGTGTLAEAMEASLYADASRTTYSAGNVLRNCRATAVHRAGDRWQVEALDASGARMLEAAVLMIAAPVLRARELMRGVDAQAAELMAMPTSTAGVVAFGFTADQGVTWPKGFGFLAPEGEGSRLIAGTFCDQKYSHRVPEGGRLIRAYFSCLDGDLPIDRHCDPPVEIARHELELVLGKLPDPVIEITRLWPRALPQYGIGHLQRMEHLQSRVDALPGLHLLGNGYRGVGLPELIRDGRAAARSVAK